jgi:NAD(P)-dependent dehydrogenase (short-subunit alcohol dehydrogenase family)
VVRRVDVLVANVGGGAAAIPPGRIGRPEEVGRASLFLACGECGFVAVIDLVGGAEPGMSAC